MPRQQSAFISAHVYRDSIAARSPSPVQYAYRTESHRVRLQDISTVWRPPRLSAPDRSGRHMRASSSQMKMTRSKLDTVIESHRLSLPRRPDSSRSSASDVHGLHLPKSASRSPYPPWPISHITALFIADRLGCHHPQHTERSTTVISQSHYQQTEDVCKQEDHRYGQSSKSAPRHLQPGRGSEWHGLLFWLGSYGSSDGQDHRWRCPGSHSMPHYVKQQLT